MARNGAGTYVLPAGQPVVTNTNISSTVFNTLTSDIATALTQSICTDGQTPMTANLAMGTHKITGLSDGTVSTDAASYGQLTTSLASYVKTDGTIPMAASLPMGTNKITGLANGTVSADAVNYGQMTAADTAITSAYIAADTAITNAYIAADRLVQAAIPGRNLIINGAMRMAQRGASMALSGGVYTFGSIDRWAASGEAGQHWTRTAAPSASGFEYVGKFGRDSGNTTLNYLVLAQALETRQSLRAAGKTVVFSFYAYKGANFSASGSQINCAVHTGTGTDQASSLLGPSSWTGDAHPIDQNPTLTTTLTRFSYSAAISSSATQFGIIFSYLPVGTAGADDNFYITGIQLEVVENGQTTPSTYEHLDYTYELNMCKRFYQQIDLSLYGGYNNTSSNISVGHMLPVTMRATPTAALITNNYNFSGLNASTTSSYLLANNSCYAIRTIALTGAGQFSELTSLTADL